MMISDEANDPLSGSAEERETWSALPLALDPVAPAADARARLLRTLHGAERYTLYASEIARAFDLSPEDAGAALRAIDDDRAWLHGPSPRSGFLVTPALRQARTVIARLPAGTRIPSHAHRGREATFVLDGSLCEDGHKHHGPGALLVMTEGTSHEIVVSDHDGCLVVFYPTPN